MHAYLYIHTMCKKSKKPIKMIQLAILLYYTVYTKEESYSFELNIRPQEFPNFFFSFLHAVARTLTYHGRICKSFSFIASSAAAYSTHSFSCFLSSCFSSQILLLFFPLLLFLPITYMYAHICGYSSTIYVYN